MADGRLVHKMDLHVLHFRMSNGLLAKVCLEPSRSDSGQKETPYPSGDLTKDLFGLPQFEPLLNRYFLLAQGRLQNHLEEWWTRKKSQVFVYT